jgi:hypothetical protein
MRSLKRFLALTPLAALLILGTAPPALGQAYGGGPKLDCAAGVVVGDHFRPNSSPAVVVDGQIVGHADVSGDGTFSFPLPVSAGGGQHTITVAGTTATLTCGGQVLGEVVVPAGANDDAGGLAFTGTGIALLTVAAALVATGIAMVVLGRRRRHPGVQVGSDGHNS